MVACFAVPPAAGELTPIDQIIALTRQAVTACVADETEMVWIEYRSGEEGTRPPERRGLKGAERPRAEIVRRDILVRVEEKGRVGMHRGGDGTPFGLEMAARCALAQARVHDLLPGFPHLPNDLATPAALEVCDPAIASLRGDGGPAADFLRPLRSGDSAGARLRWIDGRVVVVSSRGVLRAAAPTAATLEVRVGRSNFGEGGGVAAASARFLASLPVERLLATAQARTVAEPAELAASDAREARIVLSPEATARLLDALARSLFSASAYRTGSSLLRDHLGVQVFDRAFSLRDDALDPAGLPFPFDLEGTAKRPVEMVRDGAPRTPALDQRHAALLGLTATAQSSGGDDAQPENLFLAPGAASDADLLAAAGDGVWIGQLERIEVLDGRPLQVRARARQARAIRSSRLAGHLPDLAWTFSPVHAFARLTAIGAAGNALACGPTPGLLGATCSPGLALNDAGELRPA